MSEKVSLCRMNKGWFYLSVVRLKIITVRLKIYLMSLPTTIMLKLQNIAWRKTFPIVSHGSPSSLPRNLTIILKLRNSMIGFSLQWMMYTDLWRTNYLEISSKTHHDRTMSKKVNFQHQFKIFFFTAPLPPQKNCKYKHM